MLNKMFYSVRIMAVLGLSLIGTCYHAYAYITEVPYNGNKPFILLPDYTYTVQVIGVGIKTSGAETHWGEWEYKGDCRVRSIHGSNQDKQILYNKQTISPPVIYDGKKGQLILFQFLKTIPSRQPDGVFCRIEIIASDAQGNRISDAAMSSLTQMTMRENTLLDLEEQRKEQPAPPTDLHIIKQEQEQKNTLSLSNTMSSHSDDLLVPGYGDNEEADNGCCGRKKRPHGV